LGLLLRTTAIDRMEGARENVQAAGFEFQAILNAEDLGIR